MLLIIKFMFICEGQPCRVCISFCKPLNYITDDLSLFIHWKIDICHQKQNSMIQNRSYWSVKTASSNPWSQSPLCPDQWCLMWDESRWWHQTWDTCLSFTVARNENRHWVWNQIHTQYIREINYRYYRVNIYGMNYSLLIYMGYSTDSSWPSLTAYCKLHINDEGIKADKFLN